MPSCRPYTICLLASAIVIAAAQMLMPGAPTLLTIMGLYIIVGMQQWLYSRAVYATPAGRLVALAFATLMAVGVIANVHYFTTVSGGTDAAPVLNNYDAKRYFNEALWFSGNGGKPHFDTRGGLLGHFYGAIFSITGPSITVLSLICNALMAMTLPLIAGIAYRLTENKRTATLAMAAAASVCYFLASGCIIIKDAWVISGMAACAYAICNKHGVQPAVFLAGVIIVGIARSNYVLFILLGVIIMSVVDCRNRSQIIKSMTAVIVCVAMFGIQRYINTTLAVEYFNDPDTFDHFALIAPNQKAFFNIVGADTANYSVFKRLLLMPIAAVTQFLIPFPWNWMRDAIFGYSYIYAHIAYPWYLFGGILLYYLFTLRRYANKRLLAITLWGILCWILPCYFTLGTVSRYALPAVALFAPAVAVVIDQCRSRRSFAMWMTGYSCVMACVLIVCYYLQSHA